MPPRRGCKLPRFSQPIEWVCVSRGQSNFLRVPGPRRRVPRSRLRPGRESGLRLPAASVQRGRRRGGELRAADHAQPGALPADRAPQFLQPRVGREADALPAVPPGRPVSFRLALCGFYDGIYDYGTGQYERAIESIQGRLSQGHTNTAPITHTDTRSTRARSTSISPIPSWVVTVTYLSASTSRCWRAAERPGPGSLLAPWPSARAPPSRQPRRRALAPDRALSSQ